MSVWFRTKITEVVNEVNKPVGIANEKVPKLV